MADEKKCHACLRGDCSFFLGQRSEAAYESCLLATLARAEQAEQAVLKVGRDPKWAALYAWCEDNRDALFKEFSDANGAMEREIAVLQSRLHVCEVENKKLVEQMTSDMGDLAFARREGYYDGVEGAALMVADRERLDFGNQRHTIAEMMRKELLPACEFCGARNATVDMEVIGPTTATSCGPCRKIPPADRKRAS